VNLRVGTFNVLADAYIGYGDYSNVDPALLVPGARIARLLRIINELELDILGLQEVEAPLVEAVQSEERWHTFWSPKANFKPDGCLTLVRKFLTPEDFQTYYYSDGSGNVLQTLRFGDVTFANTHIKWAPTDDPDHIGISQTKELLGYLQHEERAIAVADWNDRPGGPVRQLLETNNFTVTTHGDTPTAMVNGVPLSLDVIATRGLTASRRPLPYDVSSIPNASCPSDHIPLAVDISSI
jgi:endonuclease/exonuclease/phosphatase family metal-dependent hydrolase